MDRSFNTNILKLILLCILTVASTTAFAKRRPLLLEVELNHRNTGSVVTCFQEQNGGLWVNSVNLTEWGMQPPEHPPVADSNQKYYQLSWYTGLTYEIDYATMRLKLHVPPKYFPTTTYNDEVEKLAAIRPTEPGMFFNYDLSAIRSTFLNTHSVGLSPQIGYFNAYGVGTADFVITERAIGVEKKYNAIRLGTTWTLDQPEQIASWRFGDAISSASSWSGSTRFGGIQYSTNFDTNPSLITFPLLGYQGEAALPTNMNVFVNGIMNQQRNITNGPYILQNIPVLTGAGEIRIVTQDLLGRSQVITLPYYASTSLLKVGLQDYSIETGLVRNDFGTMSNQYGPALMVGTYRRGIRDDLTVGAHAEVLARQKTLGFSADFLALHYGIVSLAMSASHAQTGDGKQLVIGINRLTQQVNYGMKSTLMSPKYQQLGLVPSQIPPSAINQFFAGYHHERWGSLGVSYTVSNSRKAPTNAFELPKSKMITLSYSHEIYKNTNFTLSGIRDCSNHQNNQIFAALTFNMDSEHTGSVFGNWQNGYKYTTMMFGKNMTKFNDYSYHVFAQNNASNHYAVDYTMQNNYGLFSGRVYDASEITNYEFSASGGVVHFANATKFTGKVNDSFALVQVPNVPKVRVYSQNQYIGDTDQKGDLLLTSILSYQKNQIRIEPRDLPFNFSFKNTESTVVPYYLSGSLVKFEVEYGKNVALQLIAPDQQFVPAGATVKIKNQNREYPVGYSGKVYLQAIQGNSLTGEATWENHHCGFTVNIPNNPAVIMNLQGIRCI